MRIYQSPFLPEGAVFIVEEPQPPMFLPIRKLPPLEIKCDQMIDFNLGFSPIIRTPFTPIVKTPSARQLHRELRALVFAITAVRCLTLQAAQILLSLQMDQARARNSQSPRFAKRKFRNAS